MQGGSVFIGSSTHALQLIANAEFLCIHWTLFSEHMLLVVPVASLGVSKGGGGLIKQRGAMGAWL